MLIGKDNQPIHCNKCRKIIKQEEGFGKDGKNYYCESCSIELDKEKE